MTVSSQTEPPILEMRGVGKHYRGVAALTDFSIGEDVAAGRLVRLLPEWSTAPAGIHALFPSARYPAPKVRVFIDALKAHLGTEAA